MSGSNVRTLVRRITNRIWFRLVLFTVLAVAVALLAGLAGPYLPEEFALEFGQDSVATILQILATSMLAVTTFSLTAMISAYASASAGTTPRATQLLVEDPTSQNALSSFLGSFVFSIVGIVALSTAYYSEQGRTLLFFATLLVIAIVVGTLLRWIHHLTRFGRLADVIDRVEHTATDAVCAYAKDPYLGGVAAREVPHDAHPVRATAPGCVTGITTAALESAADGADVDVHVVALPGVTVGLGAPLAYIEGRADERVEEAVRSAFRIESHRTYEQDPRLGLVALAEIGSRALSPATHDPGSAIEALNAIERVMTALLTTAPERDRNSARRVFVPSVPLVDLVEDALRPIARDGAGLIEIALRVQRVLRDLIAVATPHDAAVLRAASERAERRAQRELADEGDVALLAEAAARCRD